MKENSYVVLRHLTSFGNLKFPLNTFCQDDFLGKIENICSNRNDILLYLFKSYV